MLTGFSGFFASSVFEAASEAGLALSPGHWFGREGAGFARLTVAVRPSEIDQAIAGIDAAVTAR